jgi:CHASE2 domain-containing sensor protein
VEDVAVVLLDQKSYDELKQYPASFDRRLHARLLQRLKQAGARMVVFDVLFIDPSRVYPGDEEFFKAISDFGQVVVVGDIYYDKLLLKKLHGKPIPKLTLPVDPVRDRVAGWGVHVVAQDRDFAVRRHHPWRRQRS